MPVWFGIVLTESIRTRLLIIVNFIEFAKVGRHVLLPFYCCRVNGDRCVIQFLHLLGILGHFTRSGRCPTNARRSLPNRKTLDSTNRLINTVKTAAITPQMALTFSRFMTVCQKCNMETDKSKLHTRNCTDLRLTRIGIALHETICLFLKRNHRNLIQTNAITC